LAGGRAGDVAAKNDHISFASGHFPEKGRAPGIGQGLPDLFQGIFNSGQIFRFQDAHEIPRGNGNLFCFPPIFQLDFFKTSPCSFPASTAAETGRKLFILQCFCLGDDVIGSAGGDGHDCFRGIGPS
jgi:hypothetical protein